MNKYPCTMCGGCGPHEGPGHAYTTDPAHQKVVSELPTTMVDARQELQMDLSERLYSLWEGIKPSHGTPQELNAAERDAQDIVRILATLNGHPLAEGPPHQDVIASLLHYSWADVYNEYDYLTMSEKVRVTRAQHADLVKWMESRITVYLISQRSKPDGELDSFIRGMASSVMQWPTRELAQNYLTTVLVGDGEVCSMTLAQLRELGLSR